MLSAARSLELSVASAPELPRVEALEDLYRLGGGSGVRPRQGEVIMVAGRSGSQKSGFALWWVSQMNLPTLYLSADMSSYQASIRLACSQMGLTTDEVEERMAKGGRDRAEVRAALAGLNITFSFGAITWHGLDQELEAYVELYNRFPEVIVIDNLMDIEGTESDYQAQMAAMQSISDLSRATGSTVIVLHHASDKSWDAENAPWMPPSRKEVKGGLSEKPELSLTVALDPNSLAFNVACVKQRMGPCDASARTFATLQAYPELTQFHRTAQHSQGAPLRALG